MNGVPFQEKSGSALVDFGCFLRSKMNRKFIISKVFAIMNALLLLVCSILFFLGNNVALSTGLNSFPVGSFSFLFENIAGYLFSQTVLKELFALAVAAVLFLISSGISLPIP